MPHEKREQLKDIFDAALHKGIDERQPFINEKCAGDETLRLEVESLLASYQSAGNFMQDTAIAEVAEVIAGKNNPEKGKKFGHYEIIKQIGVGGMGEVYLAKDTKLDRQVALKILNANFSRHEINRNRFIQEAKAASGLNHPNILIIHEISEAEATHFIVSEFIEGKTLREIFADVPLILSEILDISIQVANALTAAHGANLVHRDIKPENIMVRPDGLVKILDFGLAKLIQQNHPISGLTDEMTIKNETAKGIIVGTVKYMSPEQAKGEKVDSRTDIFSLGVVMYEMIAGKTPFGCETVSETWTKLLHLEPEPLSQFAPYISDELQRIIGKMLRKNKDERYQTIKDLLTDLQIVKKRLEIEAELLQEKGNVGNISSVSQSQMPPNNLPENYSPIIGRENEITEIQDLLRRFEVRLLTLTGIGGTGKTKLAKAVARELLTDFKDGVFFVEIAAVTNPELIASTIAQPLGVNESGSQPILEVLKDYLREKQILLVVDNFEQVIDAAPIIAELISVAKGLKIIITSRVVLNLNAEREFIVSPLAVPTEFSQISPAELSKYEAIKLFVERAQKRKPNFSLTDENARYIAEICTRLDGLPLAIELAAARIKILSPSAILLKLENRLKLLIGGARDLPARQQTMRGAIAWSYELLKKDEKYLFRQLAVFAGGFTFEAAEAVVGSGQMAEGSQEPLINNHVEQKSLSNDNELLPSAICPLPTDFNVLDGITSLVEQNLLFSKEQANDTIRFRMLEVVREYALESLGTNGEAEARWDSHADYFLALGEEAESYLQAAQSAEWLDRLEDEHDNLRTALQWFLENDAAKAASLAATIRSFWVVRGHLTEGRGWLEAARERISGNASPDLRFKLLIALCWLMRSQGKYESAKKAYQEVLAESRAAGNKQQIALLSRGLGTVAYEQGNFKLARKFLEEGLAISREINDKFIISTCLTSLGDLARIEGKPATARRLYDESLIIFREIGNKLAVSSTYINLGAVAYQEGDYKTADAHFAEALATAQELGDRINISFSLDGFAALATKRGESELAAHLAGASAQLLESISFEIEPVERQFRNDYLSELRTSISEEEFNYAFEQGRKLKMEELIILLKVQLY